MLQAEAASPHCHLVLVEDPAEVLEELQKDGDMQQAERAADFFKQQEQYRQQRRQRLSAKQQRRQQLEQRLIAAEAAAAAAREAAVTQVTSSGPAAAPSPAALAGRTEQQQQQPSSPLAGQGSQAPSVSSVATDEDICGVCFDNSNHVAIKYCGHRLCVDCYRKVWELSGMATTCPFCRARLEGYLYLDWPLEM